MLIRPYDATRDALALRAAFVELQEVERALDPHMPPGEAIADAYLERLFQQCAEYRGGILVAEDEASGTVAGYAAVFGSVPSNEPDDDPTPHAYLSDLVVLNAFRGRGLGRALMAEVQAMARRTGMRRLRLSVLASNSAARALYKDLGFSDHVVEMEKRLSPSDSD